MLFANPPKSPYQNLSSSKSHQKISNRPKVLRSQISNPQKDILITDYLPWGNPRPPLLKMHGYLKHFHPGHQAGMCIAEISVVKIRDLGNWALHGGGHWGLRYCGIGQFFMRYFGNSNLKLRYCCILKTCGIRFFSVLVGIKVTDNLYGCLPEKNLYARYFRRNNGYYISL